ncbi:hypothetical protein BDN72DRAFT_849490 [Pluteus cervinus]|uniref:Uncharacterized protein n=1 Tax=Pluteus cervinus TaxID=181527 RepID=A0ACD3AA04_9AGAR|nr:hypothetical protein BDN72DRAFT_849490 [Pluteus cervinus]
MANRRRLKGPAELTTAVDLPLELIREIFTISARSSLKQASILARISSSIYDLIKPILFHTSIYWDDEPSWPGPFASDSEWLKLNGRHARNILFSDNGASKLTVSMILSSCRNVTNLAIWLDNVAHDDLPPLLTLRPHRLSIYLNDFFKGPFQENHAKLPMFNNLTHLDLVSQETLNWDSIQGVQYIPKLTHLSLSIPMDEVPASGSSVLPNALQYCGHLSVLILWEEMESSNSTIGFVNEMPFHQDISDDPRVVLILCASFEQWELGSQGGRDMWAVADEIVARRISTGAREL